MKNKILFVYDLENEELWKDGLWAALNLLEKDFEIFKLNLKNPNIDRDLKSWPDFVLGWGSLQGGVHEYISNFDTRGHIKKGLCLGGYLPPENELTKDNYDIIFYETNWSKDWLKNFVTDIQLIHAFGINTDIYKQLESGIEVPYPKVWDYITVGAFAYWKRQDLLSHKSGLKLAVGQIQKNNIQESLTIIGHLLLNGSAVLDMVSPERLALLYNSSKICYIPADVIGGGERAVLEARACGIDVIVEDDNPKLKELLNGPIYDHYYYAEQLKKGILECLK